MNGLISFRHELKLTREQMAARLGVSRSLYEKAELGQRNLSSNLLKAIRSQFPDVDMNIFFA